MNIISKEEARGLGLSRYFTGEPCRNGHISERSVMVGEVCKECSRESSKRYSLKNGAGKGYNYGKDHHYFKHGLCNKLPEYRTWKNIRDRCGNPKGQNYKYYMGRGIRVCDRWDDFELFLSDMGSRPTKKHQIDRIDTDGDYCPENCRWVTPRVNAQNRRSCKIWHVKGLVFDSYYDAAKHFGVNGETVRRWCVGWKCKKSYKRQRPDIAPLPDCWAVPKYPLPLIFKERK